MKTHCRDYRNSAGILGDNMKAYATFRILLGECCAVLSDTVYWKYRGVSVGNG
jgi:hypothetical protein